MAHPPQAKVHRLTRPLTRVIAADIMPELIERDLNLARRDERLREAAERRVVKQRRQRTAISGRKPIEVVSHVTFRGRLLVNETLDRPRRRRKNGRRDDIPNHDVSVDAELAQFRFRQLPHWPPPTQRI